MLRRESNSGSIDDLAHVVSAQCLSDALTKHNAKADELIRRVETGVTRHVDCHPPFRTLQRQKGYLIMWLRQYVDSRLQTSVQTKRKMKKEGFMTLD